jgi:transcriptional regulator with XRE-family HTH domain
MLLWSEVMPPSKSRIYSRYCIDAAVLLGKLIRLGRKKRKMTVQDLADRAGVSRGTVQRIEKGGLKCEMGLVFEVAALVEVKLFDADHSSLNMHIDRTNDKIALLPKSVRREHKKVDDDF